MPAGGSWEKKVQHEQTATVLSVCDRGCESESGGRDEEISSESGCIFCGEEISSEIGCIFCDEEISIWISSENGNDGSRDENPICTSRGYPHGA
jgi:hypothetical protein